MSKVEVFAVKTDAQGDDWQAATGSSSPVDVRHLEDVYVGLSGTFVATVFVDVSFDNVTWIAWESKTAPGVYTKLPPCLSFKMRTSAYTSGTPSAGGGGLRP